jgi:hypothetical protein
MSSHRRGASANREGRGEVAATRRRRGSFRVAIAAAVASLVGATLVTVALVSPAYAADTTTTTTTPTASPIVLGQSNTDGATVTGDATFGSPTGSVTFYECGPTAAPEPCTSTADPVGSPVDVTANGDGLTSSAASASFTPTSTGYWCFAGDYSGDTNYASSADNTTDECFDVTSASTSTTTAPTASTIVLGQTDTDGATVTGNQAGGSPTGSVTFYECGPTAAPEPCTSTADQVGSPVDVTANGDGLTSSAASASFTPTSTGYWCFGGDYSGDSNYTSSADNTTDECFDVTPASTTTVAAPASSTITLGQSQTDIATVTGNAAGGSPTETVSFYECGLTDVPERCTSTADQIGGAVDVDGEPGNQATATSASFTPNAEGYWCMAAVYSGDTNYNSSSDTTTDQCFYVNGPVEIVTSSPLPQATARESYETFLEGRGGNPPYKWSHAGSPLPKGLKLNKSTGEISGKPKKAGTYSFTVQIKDTSKNTASKTFSLTVVS